MTFHCSTPSTSCIRSGDTTGTSRRPPTAAYVCTLPMYKAPIPVSPDIPRRRSHGRKAVLSHPHLRHFDQSQCRCLYKPATRPSARFRTRVRGRPVPDEAPCACHSIQLSLVTASDDIAPPVASNVSVHAVRPPPVPPQRLLSSWVAFWRCPNFGSQDRQRPYDSRCFLLTPETKLNGATQCTDATTPSLQHQLPRSLSSTSGPPIIPPYCPLHVPRLPSLHA